MASVCPSDLFAHESHDLPPMFAVRKNPTTNKRRFFLFLVIFRLAFVEKTRESDDEKKREGVRQAEREGEGEG